MANIDRRPGGRYRARWHEYPGPQKTRTFGRKADAGRFLVDESLGVSAEDWLRTAAVS